MSILKQLKTCSDLRKFARPILANLAPGERGWINAGDLKPFVRSYGQQEIEWLAEYNTHVGTRRTEVLSALVECYAGPKGRTFAATLFAHFPFEVPVTPMNHVKVDSSIAFEGVSYCTSDPFS